MKRLKYIIAHRKAFRKLEKELTGRVSLSGWLHDIDKIFLIFFSRELVHKIHRIYSFHHVKNIWGRIDVEQAIIDWECARFTKEDKPLNARAVLKRKYPELEELFEPYFQKLKL